MLGATLVYCDETFTLFLSLVCVLLFNTITRPLSIQAVTMSEESHREVRQVRKIEGQRRGSTVYVFDDQAYYVKDRQYDQKLHVRCHLFKMGVVTSTLNTTL